MEYELNKLLEFAKQNVDLFEEKYEMFLAKPEDIIGRKVMSIRSGFSGDGGMVMLATETKMNGDKLTIHLTPCEESNLPPMHLQGHRGWSCDYDRRSNSFIFYKPKENMKI